MPVDDVESGQEVRERFPADGGHHRQADRRVNRVAAADPIPEPEHVVGVDPEVVDEALVGGDGHKVLGHRGVAEGVGDPAARGGGVGQGFQSRERLRRHNEKRCGGVQVGQCGDQVGGVDVGDEARRDAGIRVVAQGLVDHHRAEVRSADADVDHGADPFAGRSGPFTAAQPVGEVAHPVQHGMHVLDDVLTVDGQFGVPG